MKNIPKILNSVTHTYRFPKFSTMRRVGKYIVPDLPAFRMNV